MTPKLQKQWQKLMDLGWNSWTRADLPVLRELYKHGCSDRILPFIRPGNPLGLRELVKQWRQSPGRQPGFRLQKEKS